MTPHDCSISWDVPGRRGMWLDALGNDRINDHPFRLSASGHEAKSRVSESGPNAREGSGPHGWARRVWRPGAHANSPGRRSGNDGARERNTAGARAHQGRRSRAFAGSAGPADAQLGGGSRTGWNVAMFSISTAEISPCGLNRKLTKTFPIIAAIPGLLQEARKMS